MFFFKSLPYLYIIKEHQNTNKMKTKNLVKYVKNQNAVKYYGITEIFFYKGEICITSNWVVPFDLVAELEQELSNFNKFQSFNE